MDCPGKLSSADRMLKKLLLQSFSANVCILVIIMISCSFEKGNASRARFGGLEAYHHHYHTLPLRSMLPPFVCNQTTSKGPNGKASMKVVHRFGPCSARTQDSPTMADLMSHDKSRVKSIQARVAKSLNSGKSRGGGGGEMSESKAATNLPAENGSPGGVGNYVVTVGLGTPEKEVDLVFDTGSHLTWTQCQPCSGECYQQRRPIFNPAASTTYSNVSCTSPACSDLAAATFYSPECEDSATCYYKNSYGDQSFSKGQLATDKLTLTSTEVVDGFIFGCGQDNHLVYGGDIGGFMGLGSSSLSIVSQTSQQYANYFSYCLPTPTGSNGHLTFGKTSTNTNNLKYTTFLNSQGIGLYLIDVLAISVNGRQLQISPTVFQNTGTVIDSGTVITRLPPTAYNALRDAFKKEMTMYQEVSSDSGFDACYDFSNYTNNNPTIPKISFTFGGDLEVDLGTTEVMVAVDDRGSEVCLAFLGNEDDNSVGIFGNLQQRTLEVVYDVAGGKLGLASGGCS